jgi:hypothetical protein
MRGLSKDRNIGRKYGRVERYNGWREDMLGITRQVNGYAERQTDRDMNKPGGPPIMPGGGPPIMPGGGPGGKPPGKPPGGTAKGDEKKDVTK